MQKAQMLLVLSLLATSSLSAQKPGGHWTKTAIPTTNVPPARHENPGAASSTHLYVFGGHSNASTSTYYNDLWSFDGKAWKNETKNGATGSPPARHQAAICWDDVRGKLIVFGGQDATKKLLKDLWEWDPKTNAWKDITPSSTSASPSARQFSSMTYDPSSKAVVLFGGKDAAGHQSDTWSLVAGTLWIKQSPTKSPPARRQHHMETRYGYGDILMVGGQNTVPSKVQFKDVWQWKSGQWTEVKPGTSTTPTTVVAHDAFYDEYRERLNMSGGNTAGGVPTNFVSEYDSVNNKWYARGSDLTFGKATRAFVGYIRSLKKAYKISGQNSSPLATYVYESEKKPATAVGSAGCSTGTSVPALTHNDAWLDRKLVLEVKNTPTGATTLMGIGFAPAINVPLSVLAIGPASCVLTVNPLLVVPAGNNGSGNAELTLPLPNTPAVAGQTALIQALLTIGSTSYVSNRQDITVGAL